MSWRLPATSSPLARRRALLLARLAHSSASSHSPSNEASTSTPTAPPSPPPPPTSTPPSTSPSSPSSPSSPNLHQQADHTASSKLFADAASESAPTPSRQLQELLSKSENWTGDERIEDTVLRMLVDKYKPLRSGGVVSAEEKIRAAQQEALARGGFGRPSPSLDEQLVGGAGEREGERIIRTTSNSGEQKIVVDPEKHRPWHTTFRPPSHSTTPHIKYGSHHIKSTSPRKTPQLPQGALADPRVRAAAKLAKKRVETAGRLTRAREGTLDYRLGGGSQAGGAGKGRMENPTSIRGWTTLVEDRIEQARLAGHFNNISGRGKPLVRDLEEQNPFLAREEFFMNRIVKRNNAAPPWIELQKEVDQALTTFRRILQDSWVRRATRMLSLSHPPSTLRHLPASSAKAYRDKEWERRELGYHTSAIEEINGLIRKYNALAPYAVRRVYVTREGELERVYELAGEEIVGSFKGVYTSKTPKAGSGAGVGYEDEEGGGAGGSGLGKEQSLEGSGWSLGAFVREWIGKLAGRRRL